MYVKAYIHRRKFFIEIMLLKVASYCNFIYLCNMIRTIQAFGDYYDLFMDTLTVSEKMKVHYILDMLKIQERVSTKFVNHIQDGLFELRVEYNSNIYRLFFIFDDGQIVVLFNGFQKRTQKTPQKEITKALKIREDYYEYKRTKANAQKH